MPAPIITPSKTVHRFGETPLPEYTADQASRWAATSGVLLTSTSPRTVYNGTDYRTSIILEPVNDTRQVTITATNAGAESSQAPLQTYATLIVVPDKGVEVEEEEPANKTYAPDRKTFKVKYLGDPVERWNLQWLQRRLQDRTDVRAFRRLMRIDKPFYLDEKILGDLKLVTFDSGLKTTGGGVNLIDFSAVVREYRTQTP